MILMAPCGFSESVLFGELRFGSVGRNGVPASRHASTKMSSVTVPLLANRSRSLMHFARLVHRNCLSSRSHDVMNLSHSKRRISDEPETAWQNCVRSRYASYNLSAGESRNHCVGRTCAHALYGATMKRRSRFARMDCSAGKRSSAVTYAVKGQYVAIPCATATHWTRQTWRLKPRLGGYRTNSRR